MNSEKMYCPACGTVARPKRITKGSLATEVALWLFFLVPGLIYSVWRLASRYEGCPSCLRAGMIPLDSPVAVRALGADVVLAEKHPGPARH